LGFARFVDFFAGLGVARFAAAAGRLAEPDFPREPPFDDSVKSGSLTIAPPFKAD
jgi:hypothetical protein